MAETQIMFARGDVLTVDGSFDDVREALNAAKQGRGEAFVTFSVSGARVSVAADRVLYIKEQ